MSDSNELIGHVLTAIERLSAQQAEMSKDITKTVTIIDRDLPEMRKDLNKHIEGVMQNRARIRSLEVTIQDQEAVIEKAVNQYNKRVAPVIEHVEAMQAIPSKIKNFIITTSKILGAIAVITASAGSIAGYFLGWFGQ